jgi:hypothetical protein
MTTEEYNQALADIELARTVGDGDRGRQLSWDLWEALEEPRFQYPPKEK